ncbi:transglycosylase SLT domain-containing protein [Bradyrhizobium erythrophlei]|uniref:transglycosylase SLT domain-containing protein n=1 Tax=Bradyrhizobium erythrophlei TaxID=1437360 RepID=UPI0035EE5571
MKYFQNLAWLAAALMLAFGPAAQAQQRAQYEAMVATHARANLVPEELVHRVIVRESKYHPQLIGRGGTIGLMQIKLGTARGLGYTGTAEGLRDPETNLKYGIKYLAGAYRAANGDHDRAVRYFAGGYYYVAKRQRGEHLKQAKHIGDSAPPKELARQEQPTPDAAEAKAEQASQ